MADSKVDGRTIIIVAVIAAVAIVAVVFITTRPTTVTVQLATTTTTTTPLITTTAPATTTSSAPVTVTPTTGSVAQASDTITQGPGGPVVWHYGDPLGTNPGPYYCCFPPASNSGQFDYSGSRGCSGGAGPTGAQEGGYYLDGKDC